MFIANVLLGASVAVVPDAPSEAGTNTSFESFKKKFDAVIVDTSRGLLKTALTTEPLSTPVDRFVGAVEVTLNKAEPESVVKIKSTQ